MQLRVLKRVKRSRRNSSVLVKMPMPESPTAVKMERRTRQKLKKRIKKRKMLYDPYDEVMVDYPIYLAYYVKRQWMPRNAKKRNSTRRKKSL